MCIHGDYLGKGRQGTTAWRQWSVSRRGVLQPSVVSEYGNPWRGRKAVANSTTVDHYYGGYTGLHATRFRKQFQFYRDPVYGQVTLGGDIARFGEGYLASEMTIVRLFVVRGAYTRDVTSLYDGAAERLAKRLRARYRVPVSVVDKQPHHP